ncbi:MAG: accessory factor UbiK family protein [Bauldia sp.]|nr:accessory factor UbiK family protein [Bauldia sp.]
MNQSQNPNWFYDQFSKIFTDAASVAQGVRREAEQLFKSQAEKFVNDMDLVKREDFDAVREMAARAREENTALSARIAALEEELAKARSGSGAAAGPSETPPASAGETSPAAAKRRSASAPPSASAARRRKPSEGGPGPGEGLGG